MRVNRWKLVTMPVLVLGLSSPLLMNCGAVPKGALPDGVGDIADAASGCDEFKTGDFASLQMKGGAAVEGKVKGFLNASFKLKKLTVDIETGLIASCGELGKDLGMKDDELKAEPSDGKGAEKVCGAVAAKVQAMVKANADAKLTVEIDPPRCDVDMEAMNNCISECGAVVDPGKLEAACTGGEVSGTCEAECKGKCTVDAGAQCTGTCKASCSGKCEAGFKGACGGKCDGKCDGKDTKGECKGTCEGKCDAKAEGTCSGTCDGTCSGGCELKAAAKCSGSCSGGCSAKIKAPKCSGEYKPPSVDASCQLNCTAKTAGDVHCMPPNVRVVAAGKVNTDVNKLVLSLNKSLPKIAKVKAMADKFGGTVEGLVQATADMGTVATEAGGKALACIKAAGEATAGFKSSLDVNVKASVSVSASASGSASAKGGT